ncbi:MAG: amidase [Deltaproteobacteria bacterium]|nr:amidase [Deltaproteobacteria bacterium]
MNPLLTQSATRLAGLIRTREVSSVEVVRTHIERIKAVNPVINAVVKDRFNAAIKEAQAVDERLMAGCNKEPPPLLGVPCTIKECFALTGMPQTGGVVARKNHIADHDATAVARLKAAGAIPLGVTNVSEICMWMETNNLVYGRTKNPYNPSRIVGGSSGGEGAIIAAGGSPFGLGSDIGGSIRMPAFFNGIFGHKPTGGTVPGSGQFPPDEFPKQYNPVMRILSTGPLARRAEDLMPLLKILAGPDQIDLACEASQLGAPDGVEISALKVISIPQNGAQGVASDLMRAQDRCVDFLKEAGAATLTTTIPALRRSLDIWSAMLEVANAEGTKHQGAKNQGTNYKSFLGHQNNITLFYELAKWFFGMARHTFPAIALGLCEDLPKKFTKRTQKFAEMGQALRLELLSLMGDNGVILYPSYPSPAPRHNKPFFPPFNWVYTAIFNVMQFPVTQVPLGLNKDGLPLGVQIVGAPHKDHVTMAVAMALEKIFGGWVPPTI